MQTHGIKKDAARYLLIDLGIKPRSGTSLGLSNQVQELGYRWNVKEKKWAKRPDNKGAVNIDTNWNIQDESMLYPEHHTAVSYFLLQRQDGDVLRVKMVVCCDTPTDVGELHELRTLADAEYEGISGKWCGHIADDIDAGRLTFDLVFASELVDTRNTEKYAFQRQLESGD